MLETQFTRKRAARGNHQWWGCCWGCGAAGVRLTRNTEVKHTLVCPVLYYTQYGIIAVVAAFCRHSHAKYGGTCLAQEPGVGRTRTHDDLAPPRGLHSWVRPRKSRTCQGKCQMDPRGPNQRTAPVPSVLFKLVLFSRLEP